MSSKKLMFMFLAVILAGSLVIGAGALTAAYAQPSKIVKIYGNGFLEVKANGIKVLHVKGTAYERGYQYGALLVDEIEAALSSGITMFALKIGGGDYKAGLNQIVKGKEEMAQFIPTEHKKEMQGIADGMAAKGSNLTYDDILLWNIVNDTLCLYGKPGVWDSGKPGIRHPYPQAGCMTVTAYGEATTDGTMIVGKNMDWGSTPEMRKNPIVMVADPSDGGYGFLAPVYAGWIACIEGMNEKGIALGLEVASSDRETMHGMGWHTLTKMLLQYADSIDDAINILSVYPRATSCICHVADAKTGRAAVIEYTANAIGVIYPEAGKNVLWSTNHFNGYPGFQGYTGTNMVATQAKRLGLADISTIERWQDSLALIGKGKNGRYGRIRQLLNENYGRITVEKMIKIVSDRYDMNKRKVLGWDELREDTLLAKDVSYYKSTKKGPLYQSRHNIWSLVMVPATGDFRIAMAGPRPAQRGPFKYLNLLEELGRSW
jgi:hypothetical protein